MSGKRSPRTIRSFEELKHEVEDPPKGVGTNGKGGNGRRLSGSDDAMIEHLPLLTCLAPGCKKQFKLPWGYYDDGLDPNDPKKPLWSGVCSVSCSVELTRQKEQEAQKREKRFLAQFTVYQDDSQPQAA